MNPQVHVMYGGVSYDIDFPELELAENASDVDVRNAVANWLNQPQSKLQNFVVSRSEDGNITLRPQALFG